MSTERIDKSVSFEATEENILAVINVVKNLEKMTNKSSVEIVKKYTEGKCSSLAALINHLVPDCTVTIAATLEDDGYTIKFYHYMVKLDEKNNAKPCYYDINGKIPEKDITNYCCNLLKEPDKDKVYFTDVNHKISLNKYDPVITKCVEVLEHNPSIITSQNSASKMKR